MANSCIYRTSELTRAAQDSTGLSDFGPDDFREGLEVLVNGLNTEVTVPADRVGPLRENILRLLKNRLWLQKDVAEHPEILDEEIVAPVVITSLPRTGSTKLHRMLGASGDFQALHYWKAHMFARRPGLPDGGRELRIAETRQFEKWVYEVSPNMITGHPMFTDEPEEEFHLLNASFRTISMSIYGSDTHNTWLATADPTPGYDYLKRQLQYLQWQFSADRHKPWILKTPVHFGMEAQLCRIFENPRFIVTHRDPAKVVPSVANITQNWTVVFAEPVSNDAILKSMTEMCARLVDGHLRWRQSAPDARILDVAFRDINANNLDVVRKVYDAFGLVWSAAAEKAMWDWSNRNPRDKHGKNMYSAESLGTTDAAIRARFSNYFSNYGELLKN
jgi:Sulfotransferase family